MESTYESLKLTGHSATVITRVIGSRKKHDSENVTGQNKQGRQYNGYMSPDTRRKVNKMLDTWLTGLELVRLQSGKGTWYRSRQITFVTLTLPARQVHNDKEIRRNCLNSFIQWLKRKQSVVTYFWRAEPQKNGNIHFHLLIDRPIHWRRIRDNWNQCVEKLSYITRFEEKHGHRDPNSTDIKGLQKVQNTKAYITKYVTKTEAGRALEGRIWGCSDNLREIEAYEEPMNYDAYEVFEYLQGVKGSKELSGDFYLHLIVDVLRNLKKRACSVWFRYHQHYAGVIKSLSLSSMPASKLSGSTGKSGLAVDGASSRPSSVSNHQGKSGTQLQIEAFFQSYSSTSIQPGPV